MQIKCQVLSNPQSHCSGAKDIHTAQEAQVADPCSSVQFSVVLSRYCN